MSNSSNNYSQELTTSIIAIFYWTIVIAIVAIIVTIKVAKNVVIPALVKHITKQMGRKVYDNNIDLSKYFVELEEPSAEPKAIKVQQTDLVADFDFVYIDSNAIKVQQTDLVADFDFVYIDSEDTYYQDRYAKAAEAKDLLMDARDLIV